MVGGKGRCSAVSSPGQREAERFITGAAVPHTPVPKASLSFGERTARTLRTQWNASDRWVNTAGWAGDFVITKQIF